MKKNKKLIGIIIVAAAIIVFLVSTFGGSDRDENPAATPSATPSAARTTTPASNTAQGTTGTLTINGLDSYNGFYIYAEGYTREDISITAAADISGVMNMIFMTGAEIINGSVTLPVWRITGYDIDEEENTVINKVGYSGNDSLELYVTVWGDSDMYSSMSMSSIYSQVASGALSVTFNSGTASGRIDLPEYSPGYSIFER